MPNLWHHTTPIEALLAPARDSRDLMCFDRDLGARPLKIRKPRHLQPIAESPRSPIGKRSRISQRGQSLAERPVAVCMLPRDSIGAGGLRSRPVGAIGRDEAVMLADHRIAVAQQQQKRAAALALQAPPIVRPAAAQGASYGCADARRTRILSADSLHGSVQTNGSLHQMRSSVRAQSAAMGRFEVDIHGALADVPGERARSSPPTSRRGRVAAP
tara:strand:- start:316 stop:960 length:645 start_codon:yes stop_codon:yes gene_type:complete